MIIEVKPGALKAIKAFLAESNLENPAVRIDLRSTGCCDSSLSLVVDDVDEADHVQKTQGLTLVIHPRIYNLTGRISIDHINQPAQRGFVLTPQNPLGEWDGFGVSSIQLPD